MDTVTSSYQERGPTDKGPILPVHGAGVRANIFRAPVDTTLVDVLIAEGCADNQCFLPESQERTFDYFNQFRKAAVH